MADMWDQSTGTEDKSGGSAQSAEVTEGFEDNFVPPAMETTSEAQKSSSVNDADRRSRTPQPSTNTIADNRMSERKAKRKPSSSEAKDFQMELICPRVNCPEKIVICLDASQEMDKVSFRSRSGEKFTPLKLVKRALGIFLQTKHRIDRRHEFALILMHSTVYWAVPFTNDPNILMQFLDDLNKTYQSDALDLCSLFDSVKDNVELPEVKQPHVLPPPYIVRVLFIYGRSYCVPSFGNRKSLKSLQSSPYFFLDAYYIHEPPSEENKCEEIFDVVCNLDEKGLSYVFEVSRNPTKLYDCMAQLLPHPLQRPLQKDCSYDIEPRGTLEAT